MAIAVTAGTQHNIRICYFRPVYPIRLSERIRRILLWSIMAATALAVLMMLQVAILALGLAMLLRRTGWTVLLHQLRGLQAPKLSPTERSVSPPAPVSVLDAGCLLRV